VGRELLRHTLQILLTAAGVCVVLAWPAHLWKGPPGWAALGLAAGVTVMGALVGRVLMLALRRMDTGPEAGPRATQAGIGGRLLATLALTLPVIVAKPVPAVPFVAFLAVQYLAQLVLEVFVSLRELGQNHGPQDPAGGEPDQRARRDSPAGDEPSDEDVRGAATQ
jgi:hypothetical protein